MLAPVSFFFVAVAAATTTHGGVVEDDIAAGISPLLTKLSNELDCFPDSGRGGALEIHSAIVALSSVVDCSAKDAEHAGRFSEEASCAIMDEGDAVANITFSIFDRLANKKTDFAKFGSSIPSILDDIQTLNHSTITFCNAAIKNMAPGQLQRAISARDSRAKALDATIKTFSC